MAFLINKKIHMPQFYNCLNKIICSVFLCAGLFLSSATYALPPINDIAQTPLELTPTVEPNIMILFDDSASMDFEVMTADALSSGLFFAPNPDGSHLGSTEVGLQITHRDDCQLIAAAFGGYAYGIKSSLNQFTPNSSLGNDKANCYVADEKAWRFRCSSFNTLYYDPTQSYQPWAGLRSDGTPFPDAEINAAPVDPYQVNSATVNIEAPDSSTGIDAFRYYNCHLDENTGNFVQDIISDEAGGIDGAIVIGPGTPLQEKQNFANWFSYHRSRHLRAKALLGDFIAGQNETRIGLTQLNTSMPSLEVEEMNQSFEDEGAKRDLLDALYSLSPDEMTNSRFDDRYVQAARYLGCQSNNIFSSGVDCPSEPAPAGTCQPNHIVLASDGFQNGSNGGFSDDGFLITFGSTNEDVDSQSGEFTGGPFADTASSGLFPIDVDQVRTFSDIAIRFYRDDLRSSLPDDVQPTATDINRYPFTNASLLEVDDRLHQHIKTHVVTYAVPLETEEEAFLQFPENNANGLDPPFAWLSPLESDIGLLQNLVHGVFSGRGEYIKATDPLSGANSGVEKLTDLVAQGVGSTTPIAINTQTATANIVIYRTFYDSTSNSGDLVAQEIVINSDGTLNIESDSEPNFEWSAANQLDILVDENGASNSQRNIITYSSDTNDGINFEFDDLDPTQQSQLNQPLPGSLVLGEDRLDYLRGLTAREGTSFDAGQFRVRPETTSTGGGIVHFAKLGTIANAAPVFVGQPQAVGRFGGAWPNTDGETYFDFQVNQNDRDGSVLVAANDGMLHVFDAETGQERFAYIPSFVYENLSQLTFPEYQHRFFVDGTPIVGDVYIRNDGSSSQSWNTIVIGGLGAGGRGYYALNITDEESGDFTDQVMWEFGPEDDPDAFVDGFGVLRSDLGLSFSEPVIAMSNATDGEEQRWVAIFGNGYNNTGVDGPAVIYILFIDRGIDGDWSQSGDLVKIDLGEDGITNPNGIGDLRVIDRDGNGTADQIYAGDLLGNLHAINISSSNPNDWDLNSNRYILFEAKYSETNETQPITTRPIVVNNDGGTVDDVIVVFATGSYITNSDAVNTDIQSIYGIVDDFSGSQIDANQLVEQVLVNEQFVDADTGEITAVRIVSDNPATSSNRGWFIDFDVPVANTSAGTEFPGEKAIRAMQLRNGILFTDTVIPQALNCGPAPGGFSLALDPQTGTAGSEVIFDINNDGEFNDEDNISLSGGSVNKIIVGARYDNTSLDAVFIDSLRINQDVTGNFTVVRTNTAQTQLVGRQAWREVGF